MLPRAVRFTLKAPRLQKRIRHSENIGGLFPSRYDANGARYSRDEGKHKRALQKLAPQVRIIDEAKTKTRERQRNYK